MPLNRSMPELDRRSVLKTPVLGVGAAGLAAVAGSAPTAALTAHTAFAHGVASGDPLPTAVVLWTRVTPTAAATPGSGVGPQVSVTWQVARDATFTQILRQGRVAASAASDHSVKVDATGLQPATSYYYRFSWNGHTSRVGRTLTAPAVTAVPARLRFGVVSCANLQAGWFNPYRHLAARGDLDAILHLGDYLYEYAPGQYGYGQGDVDVRPHDPPREMVALADYRRRHAQYKTDPDLQDLHARHPFIVTWDDHEVTNDAWRAGAENHDAGEGDYLVRRARAHRAYDEWMPIRMSGTAVQGDGTRLYRRLRFGRLAELTMLDLRTYRDEQVTTGPEVSDPARTITGAAQRAFLLDSLSPGRPQWKLVGNPVMIAPVTFAQLPQSLLGPVGDLTGVLPRDGIPYNTDQWDGYTDDRREVFAHIRDQGVRDVLFLTGDIHSGWACELPYDPALAPLGDTAGVEFVCTSVTSNNLDDITGSPPRTTSLAVEETIKANNRHVKYLNFDDHGYSVLDVTSDRAQMDWYVVGDRRDRTAAATWSVSYATAAGTGRVAAASGPVQP